MLNNTDNTVSINGSKKNNFQKSLSNLQQPSQISSIQKLPEIIESKLLKLYYEGNYKKVLKLSSILKDLYSNNFLVWNFLGIAYKELGNFVEAFKAFKKVTELNPKFADGYNNLGTVLQNQGKLDESIILYNKALSINPNYPEAYCNLGNVLKDKDIAKKAIEAYRKAIYLKPDFIKAYIMLGDTLFNYGKLEESILVYKKALIFKPKNHIILHNLGLALKDQGKLKDSVDSLYKSLSINPLSAECFNTLGSTFQEQGRIKDAINAYKKALSINPDSVNYFINFQGLNLQLQEIENLTSSQSKTISKLLFEELFKNPKYLIYESISNFLKINLKTCKNFLDKYKLLSKKNYIKNLKPIDRTFCNAYFQFLCSLLKNNTFSTNSNSSIVYHLGESHCLSYAYSSFLIGDKNHVVNPKITFGAKAYHFSTKSENQYKAITSHHLKKIPKSSNVFISFGEIDCRANQGLIKAQEKSKKMIESIIDKTVEGFIEWFDNENKLNKHYYFFFNIPAPVYNVKYSEGLNKKISKNIHYFNSSLSQKISLSRYSIIDVYRLTVDKRGFSNGLYHTDQWHLDGRIIAEINKQLNL